MARNSPASYNDGARKIFLYTKGTEGNPSQEIRDVLKYIQESTKENATNENIASIQKLMDKVKHKREIGINYMKSWKYEQMIEKEAREFGYKDGYNEGYDTGRNDGFNDGFNDGHNKGFSDGTNNGTEKMSQLIISLTEVGRTEDILKAAQNMKYREQLLKEFGL